MTNRATHGVARLARRELLGFLAASAALATLPATAAPARSTGYVTGPYGRMRYEKIGQGPALILVAGGPGASLRSLGTQFDALADIRTVIYFDNIGRGYSDRLRPGLAHSPQRDAEDIETLRTSLNLGRIDLLGHSYGGFPALAYLQAHDREVRHLVLSSTGHSHDAWQANIDSYARFVEDQYPEVWEAMLALRAAGVKSSDERFHKLMARADAEAYWYDVANKAKLPLSQDPRERSSRDVYLSILGDDPEVKVGGSMATFDASSALAGTHARVLVTAGRYDRIMMPKLAMQMARLVPQGQGRLEIFERSGHSPWVEEQDRYMQVLREFLLAD
ncbi:MAG: alpha/beta fold hydrolase [Ramlibacter sp.]